MMENSHSHWHRSVSLFTALSDSFSSSSSEKEKQANSNSQYTKSPRNFEGGMVGLGIVAAMTNSTHTHDDSSVFSIPIVSLAKPAANFRGLMEQVVVDEDSDSEGYTCVISHFTHNTINKRVYFDDFVATTTNTDSTRGVFSTSPLNSGDPASTRFWSADFLNSCNLCNKHLHGVDIFIYRGERAFCSAECRETHIRNDDYQEKCKSGAMKSLDCSMSPPPVSFAGIVAA